MDSLVIVHSGEAWTHAGPPCSRAMIRFLERNEEVVTWVQVRVMVAFVPARWPDRLAQPKDGGVEDQFPVIRMGGQFYSMSLRMMKAVWSASPLPMPGLSCSDRPAGVTSGSRRASSTWSARRSGG